MQDSGDCYAIAMALRGEIALRGLQTLKGFDNPRPYYDDLFQVTEAFRSVSPHRIPRATLGSSKSLKKPASGIATETRSERSDAARQILAAAKTATPSKPLLVLCQGSMRDVACAWLMDPSIADRVVVAGDRKWANAERRIRGRAYGPPRSDPWAFEIVATHFRCLLVNLSGLEFGPELSDRVTDPKWCSLKKCGTGTHCGFGLLYHVSRPDHQITIKRLRFVRVDKHRPVFEEDPEGKTWEIDIKGEREKLRDEFRRVFLRRHR